MRSRQLECFVCVCETGSITRASYKLNIAQPALGMQLRALEREFGVRLLTRTPAGTLPTAAGALFLDEARRILAQLKELRRRLAEIDDHRSVTVCVGMPPSLTGRLASRLLARGRKELPSLRISILEGPSNEIVEKVQSGQIQIGVAFDARVGGDLTADPILDESLCLIVTAGASGAIRRPIPLEALRKVDLTMPGEGDVVRRILTETMHRHGMRPNIVYPVSSMPAMIDVVVAGLACAVLPASAVARQVSEGRLIARPIVKPNLKRTLSMVRTAAPPPGAEMTQLCSLIVSALRQIAPLNPSFEMRDPSSATTGSGRARRRR